MKKFILAFGAAVTLVMAGCLKNGDDINTRTCNYDPCAGKAPAAEIQKVKAYLDSAGITAVEQCSGLFYKIDEPGTGKTAEACSGVYVQYKGQLANGNVFDSTAANDSVGFYLNQVTGLDERCTPGKRRRTYSFIHTSFFRLWLSFKRAYTGKLHACV